MTSQFDFTTDQWTHLASTPLLVGLAVAKAEDSGFLGSIRETRTLSSSIVAPDDGNPARSLIDQAATTDVGDLVDVYKATNAEGLAMTAVRACEELAAILDQVAEPDETKGYKAWVLDVARTVAEAAKEDGVRVSPGEADLIERIASALS